VCNLGFFSAATRRNIPSSLILLHRTQATTPPASTTNVPARKSFFMIDLCIYIYILFQMASSFIRHLARPVLASSKGKNQ